MAKKKKNKQLDARGYVQTQPPSSTNNKPAPPVSLPFPPTDTTTTSSTPPAASSIALVQPTTDAPVSSSSEEPKIQPSEEEEDAPPAGHNHNILPRPGPSDRFKRRMTTIYDKLVHDPPHYFTHQQLEMAAVALGYEITLELALDWLCLNLPVEELPPILTDDMAVRSSPTTTNKDGGVLQVIAPLPSSSLALPSRGSDSIVDLAPAEAPGLTANSLTGGDSLSPPSPPSATSTTILHKSTANNKDKILQQYQYEENDDHDDGVNDDKRRTRDHYKARASTSTVPQEASVALPALEESILPATNNVGGQAGEEEENAPTTPAERAKSPLEPLSPDEMTLQKLRVELEHVQADANDPATNYMRSKDEIRILQRRVRELQRHVGALERKVDKQQRLHHPPKSSDAPSDGVLPIEGLTESDEGPGGLFDLFDEGPAASASSTTEPSKASTSKEPDQVPSMFFPDDYIPKSWTGKTPQRLLQEYCTKARLSKPLYSYDTTNGCRVHIQSTDRLNATLSGPLHRSDKVAAQEYVATQLLYQVYPDRPLHRILPPFYANLWREWSGAQRSAVLKAKETQKADKNQRILDLMQAIAQNKELQYNYSANANVGERLGSTADDTPSDRRSQNPRALSEPHDDPRIYQQFQERCETKSYQSMLRYRTSLPIFPYKGHVLDTIDKNAVTVLCAETGAGKTTNCGQFLLEEALRNGRRVSILCSQPRRVAATSVAERVAEEMGEAGVGKLVGYQIRLESRKSPDTRLLFCTTGVILRKLVDDPFLHGVTHILVDEVHERQWQVDVLLILIRNLLNGPRPDLKVVLMSATLDAELFCTFFGRAPLVSVPGRTFPVANYYLEDVLEETNHLIEEDSPYALHFDLRNQSETSILVTTRGGEKTRETHSSQLDESLSGNFAGYSLQTQRSMDRVDETLINYDLIEDLLAVLLLKSADARTVLFPPRESNPSIGSVLVFLPGIGEIRALSERLEGSRDFGRSGSFDIIPMHSSLSSAEQRRAFRPSPAGVRKIILATNIAETSVTLPDVVCVIDTGRVRELQQDRRTNTPKLITTWCSRASTKQRAGRAGRVQPGTCLKLYSSKTERSVMKELSEPELTRIPLEEVCLSILATGLVTQGCRRFLAQAPQPPLEKMVDAALHRLQVIGAVAFSDSSEMYDLQHPVCEKLTPLGSHLSQLPVDARLGKMLVYGALFKCIDPISTIVACLSASKSVFVTSWGDNTKAKSVHTKFHHPFSDFLTLVNVYQAFEEADTSGTTRRFCQDHFLSLSALREARDSKTLFVQILCGLGFVDGTMTGVSRSGGTRRLDRSLLTSSRDNIYGGTESIVHSVVLAGLYPHVGQLLDDPAFSKAQRIAPTVLLHQTERLEVHTSSVNRTLRSPPPSLWLTFDEKFGTGGGGGRRVTASTTCFVDPLALLVFGANMEIRHLDRLVVVDKWIELAVAAYTAVRIQQLRLQLTNVLRDYWCTSSSVGSRRSALAAPAAGAAAAAETVVNAVVDLLMTSTKDRR